MILEELLRVSHKSEQQRYPEESPTDYILIWADNVLIINYYRLSFWSSLEIQIVDMCDVFNFQTR